MRERGPADRHRFHEFPLVLFSALAIAGGGLAAARPLGYALGAVPWIPGRAASAAVALLLGCGLLASLLHLGRKDRSLCALRRTGRSALSTEIFLAALTLGFALAVAALPDRGALAAILWGLVTLPALALLISLGRVYSLRGQLTWRGAAAASPVVLGLAFGLVQQAAAMPANGTPVVRLVLLLFAADAALCVLRWRQAERAFLLGRPAHPALFEARHRILAMRSLAVPLLSFAGVLLQAAPAALVNIGFGILLDRFAFYALAVQSNTDAEIARIEAILRAGDKAAP